MGLDISIITIMAAFFTQIGARHLALPFTPAQRKLLQHPLTQMIILFAMFFFSTRNLWIALGLIIIFYLALQVLLNEAHPYNIYSKNWLALNGVHFGDNTQSPQDIYRENMKKLGFM